MKREIFIIAGFDVRLYCEGGGRCEENIIVTIPDDCEPHEVAELAREQAILQGWEMGCYCPKCKDEY